MTCCLMTWSQLNQCWISFNNVLCYVYHGRCEDNYRKSTNKAFLFLYCFLRTHLKPLPSSQLDKKIYFHSFSWIFHCILFLRSKDASTGSGNNLGPPRLHQRLPNFVVHICISRSQCVYSWPSDTKWWHTAGSTLAEAIACCLMALNHYLNSKTFVDLLILIKFQDIFTL